MLHLLHTQGPRHSSRLMATKNKYSASVFCTYPETSTFIPSHRNNELGTFITYPGTPDIIQVIILRVKNA